MASYRFSVLNVGQADTNVIITPAGNVIVIDASRPAKLVDLLATLGLQKGEQIAHLIITHPHLDHFDGANRLVKDYAVVGATLSPFWNKFGMALRTYQALSARCSRSKCEAVSCRDTVGFIRMVPC